MIWKDFSNGFYKHPLLPIAIAYSIGIIMGKNLPGQIPSMAWYAVMLLMFSTALALGGKTRIIVRGNLLTISLMKAHVQTTLIYLTFLTLGAYLASSDMERSQRAILTQSYEELSPLDRTILKAQTLQKGIGQKMKDFGITGQDYAIISAMTIGDKSALDQDTKEAFSISGASHILAISGLHIGILFQIFILLLGKGKGSYVRLSSSLMAIWGYAVIIGLPTSVVRAAIMISIYVFCRMLHRDALTINSLSLAYLIILIANPQDLYDISFQMSFLAVLSIVLFYPIFCDFIPKAWKRHSFLQSLWNLAAISLSAQIGTMPVIVYYFGRISCYSLLTNFIAIPYATIVIYGSLLVFALMPLTQIQVFVAHLLSTVVHTGNQAFAAISRLPGASIENVHANVWQIYLTYICIYACYIILLKNMRLRGFILSQNEQKNDTRKGTEKSTQKP